MVELDLEDPHTLVRWVREKRLPGQRFVELDGEVPWGAQPLNRALLHFEAAEGLQGVDVWSMRPVTESRWPSVPIYTVLDVSSLFCDMRSFEEVMTSFAHLPYLPPPQELVAINPHGVTLSHQLLDEVALRLDASVGWVYLGGDPSGLDPHAVKECTRTVTGWGVRQH